MKATHPSATETLHRLLFRALLEMRLQGQEEKNKVVFHLADLFPNIVLEMENAAQERCTHEDVLKLLEERAREKGLDKWFDQNRAELKQPFGPVISNQ